MGGRTQVHHRAPLTGLVLLKRDRNRFDTRIKFVLRNFTSPDYASLFQIRRVTRRRSAASLRSKYAQAVGRKRFVEPWVKNFFVIECYGIEICTTRGRNSPAMKLLLILAFVIAFPFNRTNVARGGEADPIEVYTWGQQPTSAATERCWGLTNSVTNFALENSPGKYRWLQTRTWRTWNWKEPVLNTPRIGQVSA